MGYRDPCANNPEHGLAVVGINPPPGSSAKTWWVCMDCFEAWLSERRELVDHLSGLLNVPIGRYLGRS
jgi:hypothetical protein